MHGTGLLQLVQGYLKEKAVAVAGDCRSWCMWGAATPSTHSHSQPVHASGYRQASTWQGPRTTHRALHSGSGKVTAGSFLCVPLHAWPFHFCSVAELAERSCWVCTVVTPGSNACSRGVWLPWHQGQQSSPMHLFPVGGVRLSNLPAPHLVACKQGWWA